MPAPPARADFPAARARPRDQGVKQQRAPPRPGTERFSSPGHPSTEVEGTRRVMTDPTSGSGPGAPDAPGPYGTAAHAYWRAVDTSAGPDGCWPWLAGKSHGYGRFSIDGTYVYTNRENILRGTNPAAVAARADACAHGHPYDATNTRLSSRGGRVCRTCHNERARRAYERDPEKFRARSRENSRTRTRGEVA